MLFLCFFQRPRYCLLQSPTGSFFFLLLKANYVVGCVVYCFHPRSGGSDFFFNFFFERNWSIPVPSLILDRGKKTNLECIKVAGA